MKTYTFGMLYRLVCPVCGKAFEARGKVFLNGIWIELCKHVKNNHRRWLNEWYRRNRKNFLYVRRECLKPFKKQMPIGWTGAGEVLTPIAYDEWLTKMRNANSYEELDGALQEIMKACSKYRSVKDPAEARRLFATGVQVAALMEWLVLYVLRKEAQLIVLG